MLKLFLFTTNLNFALKAQAAGIDGIIIDWESLGKEGRQAGFDLETNRDNPDDVRRLSAKLSIPVIVRINSFGEISGKEVNCAL